MEIYIIPYSIINRQSSTISCNEVALNIVIDTIDVELMFFTRLVTLRQTFFVSLSSHILNHPRFSDLLQCLYTIYTLSDRFIVKDAIPVLSDGSEFMLTKVRECESYFWLQGEDDFCCLIIHESNNPSHGIQLMDIGELQNLNEEKIQFYLNSSIRQLFVKSSEPHLIQEHISTVQSLKHDSIYVRALFNFLELQRYKSAYAQDTSLWKERTKLYLSYIGLSKQVGESEYYEIKRWYQLEYEVLPLWYKRVGHLIKVLKGKRSFKSLFKNN